MENGRVHIAQAKQFLGKNVVVTYKDRNGNVQTKTTRVYDVAYVPSYGACLVGETEDIWLDKVMQISEAV